MTETEQKPTLEPTPKYRVWQGLNSGVCFSHVFKHLDEAFTAAETLCRSRFPVIEGSNIKVGIDEIRRG